MPQNPSSDDSIKISTKKSRPLRSGIFMKSAELSFRTRFREAGQARALVRPLSALLEQVDAFEAFEYGAARRTGGGTFEAGVLRHVSISPS